MPQALAIPKALSKQRELTNSQCGSTPHWGNASYNNTSCHLAGVGTAVSGEQQGCTFTNTSS